ncbi:MAG: radical SAM family heme chaperone HemW [Thermoleophilia bacterium]|nr:radical SAM family heme chaperone HemW [Thermoleophilia bacterium]
MTPAAPPPAGGVRHLYLHLPFCAARCGYCAFVVEVGREEVRDAYLDALLAELAQEGGRLGPLETVYLGGGTPTLMGAGRLTRLLEALAPRLAGGAEVTVEANPETVDRTLARALVAAGVTRVSLGAQSFQPHLLAALDRRATPARVRAAAGLLREAGVGRLSLDLIQAVPGQTMADLERDIAEVGAIGPDHVSWYELEVKPGSALAARGAVVDPDLAEDAYLRVVDALEDMGYRWYELANFARDGARCRHSLAYWTARDYLGLGVGAVSTVAGTRWRNAPGVDRYVAALAAGRRPPRTREPLAPATRRRERWMLATRLDEPLDLGWAGPPDHPEAVPRLAGLGLVEAGAGTLTLTRRGRLLQNAVVQELMDFST